MQEEEKKGLMRDTSRLIRNEGGGVPSKVFMRGTGRLIRNKAEHPRGHKKEGG